MEKAQENFILEQLTQYRLCKINNIIPENISTDIISYIFEEKFANGSDMEVLLCIFEKIILSTALKQNKDNSVLYTLSSDINDWITDIKKISVVSNQGFVYNGNILSQGIKVLIKIPQKEINFDFLIREYFIGLTSINKLRYIIPTFVYTLGAFLCSQPYYEGDDIDSGKLYRKSDCEKTIYVMYENIPGETLTDILVSGSISFNDWLGVFCQILLSLEISQREIGFTHFDLHTGNVMIRKNTINYDIALDNICYSISTNHLPVIIDFGTSCVFVENRYVGSYKYMPYRMLNFMVSGYDMYKFLIYSCMYAKSSLSQKIQKLFKFYGTSDPYSIISTGKEGVNNAFETFCSKVTDSIVARYTPLMFLTWIQQKYTKILSKNIKISLRTQYKFLKHSTISFMNEKLSNTNNQNIIDTVELIEECITKYPSYILCKYNMNILENYMHSPIQHILKRLKTFLDHSKDVLIMLDLAKLENVFDIIVPDQLELTQTMDSVLEIPIIWKGVQDKLDAVTNIRNISYENDLEPYLQLYHTILELKLDDKFSDWINRFNSSNIYNFYLKNRLKFSQALRWSKTLRASIVI